MSKSLKNTISIQEYLRTNSPNYLRMLCLYTNYRTCKYRKEKSKLPFYCVFFSFIIHLFYLFFVFHGAVINFDGEEERYSVKMCTKFYEFLDDCRAYIHGGSNKGDIDQIHLLKVKCL